jgi:phosphogluconate dehydratase
MSAAGSRAPLHPGIARVTERIIERSRERRRAYLKGCAAMAERTRGVQRMGCANVAHALAAMPVNERLAALSPKAANLGIVTAYNDMLSAHKPYEHYPAMLRQAAAELGATAQVAGGVPAMCDGVTQGFEGMELSLFSRDVIAMATAVSLSHDVFDGALMLGVCDKIVPGLLIGALQFGHLPTLFVPAGPMTSGLSNEAKSSMRQRAAMGQVGRDELLAAEQAAYHGPGTCTFYGTANSNQMLLETMGLQLPGSSFVNPGTALRRALDLEAVRVLISLVRRRQAAARLAEIVSERAIVNAMVGLLASGGSTNHTIHLVAIARAGGVLIDWDDFADLSAVVPLLASVYPNGKADVNDFHAAGGMPVLIAELLGAGLLHGDVHTVMGVGLQTMTVVPALDDAGRLVWQQAGSTRDSSVLRSANDPFSSDGGLRLLQGNLGRAVVKVSAVKSAHRKVRAPAVVVNNQEALAAMFSRGELNRDLVAVVRGQGPRSNGMPELHKLTPLLGALQDHGFAVALLTDGRMSGASGKIPAAIHLSPDAVAGGPISLLRSGDMIELDCESGVLRAHVDEADWARREPWLPASDDTSQTLGRGLFALFRQQAAPTEDGASALLA